MNTPPFSGTEADRIKEAYRRREIAIPKDRYSLFKEENLLTHLDLQSEILRVFKRFTRTCLETEKILDVGCGRAYWLRQMIQWGAKPENLFGIDLMADRLRDAKNLCPPQVTFQ